MTEISSFWYTPKGYKGIGLMEILTIKSWLDNGYKFHLYTYNLEDKIFLKFQELFNNFILKDANEIVPFSEYFSDDKGAGVAAFSDFFRFNLLYLRGGVWVDLDMVCLSPYDYNEKEYIFSKEIDDDPNKARITTSLLKFPKQSEFGKLLIEEAKKIVDNRKTIPWGVIGPWFLAKWVKECGLEKHALDYKDTCQIPWKNARDFIDKKKTFDENRPCLHLFSEMWRSYKMNKNHFYLKETIYGQLLDRHKIQNLLNRLSFTKNQTKTVGVVIPIYNVEKYLRECLDSVVNQTYKNLQVVLVNDGSTDENSLNIAKEYTLKDERFILFDKENGGQSTARNVGIEFFSKEYDFKNITQELKENSLVEFKLDNEDNPYNIYKIYKSSNFFKNKDELLNFKAPDIDYIIFLDSDDYWELNCIEECVPRMDGVDILWFKEKVVNQTFKDISTTSIFDKYFTGRNIITKFEWIERQFIKDDFFQFVCFGVINFHFLKKISLMFENYIIGEDRIFGILLFLQSNFIYMLEKELYVYRIRDYSSCNYSNKKILPPPIYVLEFGNVKNIHLHIDVLSNIRMLLSLIAYLKDNTIDLESKLICEKLFIPSFYRNISQSIFKCSKISIEYKISFFKIDKSWLKYVINKKYMHYFFSKIASYRYIFFIFAILYTIIFRLEIPKIKK